MLKFICVFFPAVLSVWAFEALTKQQMGIKHWVYRFCLNSVICNGFVCLLKIAVTHTSHELLNQAVSDMSPDIALRYLVMALPAAVAAAVIEALLNKGISVKVSENSDEGEK